MEQTFILGDEDIDPQTGKVVGGNEEAEAKAAQEAADAEAAKAAEANSTEAPAEEQGNGAAAPNVEETAATSDEEPVIDIDGTQYTLSQVKEMQEALANKDQWQASNTQKAQEVAEKRRLVDEVLEQINSNPSLIQRGPQQEQTAAPDPLTEANAELQALYGARPEDPFSPEARTWEKSKDDAIRKVSRLEAVQEAQQTAAQTSSIEHNRTVATDAYDRFSKTISDEEYTELEKWVANNIRPDAQGRYSKQGFDIAYKMLHGEKTARAEKLEQTRSIGAALQAGANAEGRGGAKTIHTKLTEADQEDNEFVSRVKERMNHSR